MTAVTVLLAVITLCMLVFAVLGVLLYKKISQLLTTTERSVEAVVPRNQSLRTHEINLSERRKIRSHSSPVFS